MSRSAVFALAICLAQIAAHASARDLYVNNIAGDDLSNGLAMTREGQSAGPVRTINQALRLSRKGDRIHLAKTDMPYHEMLSLSTGRHWGTPLTPFTIIGNGAILDGSAPVPHDAWQHVTGSVFRFQPERLSHQQLFLEGRPAARVNWGPTSIVDLEPLQWTLSDGWIYFRAEDNRTPRDYPLSYARLQTGITLYHVRHVRIENLIVQGFQLDGINAHDGCVDCLLTNVTARGNGRSGVSVGNASRLSLDFALIGDNGRAQLRTEGRSITAVNESDLLDNTAPAYVIEGGELYLDGQLVQDAETAE